MLLYSIREMRRTGVLPTLGLPPLQVSAYSCRPPAVGSLTEAPPVPEALPPVPLLLPLPPAPPPVPTLPPLPLPDEPPDAPVKAPPRPAQPAASASAASQDKQKVLLPAIASLVWIRTRAEPRTVFRRYEFRRRALSRSGVRIRDAPSGTSECTQPRADGQSLVHTVTTRLSISTGAVGEQVSAVAADVDL